MARGLGKSPARRTGRLVDLLHGNLHGGTAAMLRWIRSRRRGAVMVEYAFLLMAVGIPAVAGLTLGGQQMYKNYVKARNDMLWPMP